MGLGLSLTACGRIGYTSIDLAGVPTDAAAGEVRDTANGTSTEVATADVSNNPPTDAGDVGASPPTDGSPSDVTTMVSDAAADTPVGPVDASMPTDGTTSSPPDACGSCQPGAVSLQGQPVTATPSRGGTGTAQSLTCPGDQVVIGYDGTQSRNQVYPWLQSVAAHCGHVTVSGTGPYSVTVTPAGQLASQGQTGPVAWSRPCPANQVVAGFDGRAAAWVGQLAFRCAPLVVSGTAGGFVVTVGPVTILATAGSNSGSPFPTTDCPAGQIASGQDVISGQWMDAFALRCAAPVVLPR